MTFVGAMRDIGQGVSGNSLHGHAFSLPTRIFKAR